MADLPVFLRIENRPCLVVGGGNKAAATIEKLIQTNAQITVVSPTLNATLQQKVKRGLLRHQSDCFNPQFLDGHALVVAATDNPLSNRWIAEHAIRRNVPVSVITNPHLGNIVLADNAPVFAPPSSRTGGGFESQNRDSV